MVEGHAYFDAPTGAVDEIWMRHRATIGRSWFAACQNSLILLTTSVPHPIFWASPFMDAVLTLGRTQLPLLDHSQPVPKPSLVIYPRLTLVQQPIRPRVTCPVSVISRHRVGKQHRLGDSRQAVQPWDLAARMPPVR